MKNRNLRDYTFTIFFKSLIFHVIFMDCRSPAPMPANYHSSRIALQLGAGGKPSTWFPPGGCRAKRVSAKRLCLALPPLLSLLLFVLASPGLLSPPWLLCLALVCSFPSPSCLLASPSCFSCSSSHFLFCFFDLV